jgi:hypothetical protein
MLGDVKTLNHRLLARRCLECGYDGAILRGGLAEQCPRCGCDLRRRPPRSYAEMEGLIGLPLAVDGRAPGSSATLGSASAADTIVQRWLVFLFIWMAMIVAIVCLTAAAITV